jgi:4-hydroxy-tetrahydrodipicolinate synthase
MFKGSMPALVTPMSDDGAVDFAAWDKLLDFHLAQGTDAVVVGGTTGESPVLEPTELERLVKAAKRRVGGQLPVIAGSGTNGTEKSAALSRVAEAAGADALLVVTPYYNKPTQEGLYRHFNAVADAVSLPVILYNVPARTACDMLPETVGRLARHPNIVGIKEATGEVARCVEILRLAGEDFLVLSGDDPSAADLIRAGAKGVISVTANVAARAMHDMCEAGLAGRHDDASRMNEQLMPLHGALFVESSPIPVKWAVQRLGLIGPGIRLPMTPLTDAARPKVEAAMRAVGIDLP